MNILNPGIAYFNQLDVMGGESCLNTTVSRSPDHPLWRRGGGARPPPCWSCLAKTLPEQRHPSGPGEARSGGLCRDTAASLGSQVLCPSGGGPERCAPRWFTRAPQCWLPLTSYLLGAPMGPSPGIPRSSPTSVFLGPRQEGPLPVHFTPAWWGDVPRTGGRARGGLRPGPAIPRSG